MTPFPIPDIGSPIIIADGSWTTRSAGAGACCLLGTWTLWEFGCPITANGSYEAELRAVRLACSAALRRGIRSAHVISDAGLSADAAADLGRFLVIYLPREHELIARSHLLAVLARRGDAQLPEWTYGILSEC